VVFCIGGRDRSIEAGNGPKAEILDGGSVKLTAGGRLLFKLLESIGIFVGERVAQSREAVEDVAFVMEMETKHGWALLRFFWFYANQGRQFQGQTLGKRVRAADQKLEILIDLMCRLFA
jgi:hypothetical protein